MEEGKAARKIEQSSTTGGLPVSPSLGPTLEAAEVPHEGTAFGPRAVYVSIAAMVVGLAAALASRALIYLIWFLTNLFFYHRFSVEIIHQPMEIVSPVVMLRRPTSAAMSPEYAESTSLRSLPWMIIRRLTRSRLRVRGL